MTNDKGEAARKASEGMKELLKSFVEMCQSRGDDYEPEQLEWLIEKFEASNRIKFDDDILDAALTRVLEEINPTAYSRECASRPRIIPGGTHESAQLGFSHHSVFRFRHGSGVLPLFHRRRAGAPIGAARTAQSLIG